MTSLLDITGSDEKKKNPGHLKQSDQSQGKAETIRLRIISQ